MDLVNLSQANNKYLITGENKTSQVGAQAQTQMQPQVQPQAQPQVQTEPVREESGDKKLLGALAALGAIAAAGVGIALAVKKGKNPAKALSDINFNKGVAKLNNGKNYTGIIQDTLKNGDKITLEYADGILKKSTRSGRQSFEKVYQTLEDGSKVVVKTQGDNVVKTNITEIQNNVKKAQKDLKELIDKKDELNITEFKKQADTITFKSKKQQNEINDILNQKQKVLDEKKAEEAAQKAREEAVQKAQEEARKKAEEAARKAEGQAQKAKETIENAINHAQDKLNSDDIQELKEVRVELSKQIVNSPYGCEIGLSLDEQKNNQILRKRIVELDEKIRTLEVQEEYNNIVKKMQLAADSIIKDAKTGENIPVIIEKSASKNGGSYLMTLGDNKNTYGLADVSLPEKSAYFFTLPDGYSESSLELHYLAGSGKTKGAGRELIKQVVKDSKDLGYGGRVKVDACGGSLPTYFHAIAGNEKMKTSPVPFYYKCGFRFNDAELNKQVEEGIANLSKGLEYTGPSGGAMFLPDEAVQKLLNS